MGTPPVAVFVGVIVSALVFAWKHAQAVHSLNHTDKHGSKIYSLRGPLFFGSVNNFLELFDPKNDPQDVIIDFKHARVADHSAIEAIDTLSERYIKLGKTLHLRHLSSDCISLLQKTGKMVEVTMTEDPHYFVADDKLG